MTERPFRAIPDEEISQLMQRGRVAAQAGHRVRARWLFSAVLESDPTYVDAWIERAAVTADSHEALACLAQALTLDPSNERARRLLRMRRREVASAPSLAAAPGTLPAPRSSPTPVPPVSMGAYQPPRGFPRAWLLVGLLPVLLLLSLLLWTDIPRGVMAALLPTATPTFTLTPTRMPTHTPAPSPTPTWTPTPTSPPTATPTSTPLPSPTPSPTPHPTQVPADKSESAKWIEVDLSAQRLYAHEGQKTVLTAVVSTGIRSHPTRTGRFRIYAKYRSTPMSGPGYYLPGVPWTMYYSAGFAIHGTYWHHNFGRPMSHGCINMKTNEAKWLYGWAPKGTLVVIHR